jgi:hypothetical protein
MRKVTGVDRHSWGFELELECGHPAFHFTAEEKPPAAARCDDCANPNLAGQGPNVARAKD